MKNKKITAIIMAMLLSITNVMPALASDALNDNTEQKAFTLVTGKEQKSETDPPILEEKDSSKRGRRHCGGGEGRRAARECI
ncbi:MAG: hypothetical protein QM793_10430 [Muricomes sp.]